MLGDAERNSISNAASNVGRIDPILIGIDNMQMLGLGMSRNAGPVVRLFRNSRSQALRAPRA